MGVHSDPHLRRGVVSRLLGGHARTSIRRDCPHVVEYDDWLQHRPRQPVFRAAPSAPLISDSGTTCSLVDALSGGFDARVHLGRNLPIARDRVLRGDDRSHDTGPFRWWSMLAVLRASGAQLCAYPFECDDGASVIPPHPTPLLLRAASSEPAARRHLLHPGLRRCLFRRSGQSASKREASADSAGAARTSRC